MPAFVATYTQEQRAALARAVLGDGMSVRAALDAAKAGKLPGLTAQDARDLQPLSYTYACQIVREQRDELDGVQLARSQPNTVTRDAAVKLLRRAQRDAETIANGRKGLMDTGAALQTLRVIDAAQKVLAGLEPRKAPAKAEGAEQKRARSLAAVIAAGSNTEDGDTSPIPSATGEHHAARDNQREEETDGLGGGSARSSAAAAAA